MQPSSSDIDLKTVAGRLRRNWWIIAIAVFIGAAIGVGRSVAEPTTYTAHSLVYLGQPVSPNGGILPTVSSRAATALDIAQGDEAIRTASRKAGISAQRVRSGLVVTTAQSPLASKLASTPMMMRIVMKDRSQRVATNVARAISSYLVNQSNEYVRDKQAASRRQISSLENSIAQLESQRATAVTRVGSSAGAEQATWALLASNTGRDLADVRTQLDDLQAAVVLTKEIEASRVIDKPSASRDSRKPLAPAAFMWGLIGLIAGGCIALVVGRRRATGDGQSS